MFLVSHQRPLSGSRLRLNGDVTLDETDHHWMRLAVQMARSAMQADEVPVGAVMVRHNQLVTQAGNQVVARCDPTAHAEMLVIRQASEMMGQHRLLDCELYVTLEPCTMCLGALIQARIKRLVFGLHDLKAGACGGCLDLTGLALHQHHFETQSGVLAQDSHALLQKFFRAKRSGGER